MPSNRNNEDDGIQIIEIDDGGAPHKNGVRQSNGNRYSTMSSELRKRNLEVTVCDSDAISMDGGPPLNKRLRQN